MRITLHARRLWAGNDWAAAVALLWAAMQTGWAASPADAGPPSPPRPNIIVLVAGDLGYGDLGCYGQASGRTPNLDRMAAEGMRFTQCYAGSSLRAPSRASLMTGRHTGHHSIRGDAGISLRAADVTIAEVLKAAGYRTAAIGLWPLGRQGSAGLPRRQGFDEWFGFLAEEAAKDDYPTTVSRNETEFLLEGNLGGRKGDHVQDWFTRAATNFIRLQGDRPFFLHVGYTIPRPDHPPDPNRAQQTEAAAGATPAGESGPQAERRRAAMITRLDRHVGLILAELRRRGLDQRTLVFFTSDHGPQAQAGVNPRVLQGTGSLRGHQGTLYEGGIRAPMIAWWPGTVPAAAVNNVVWAFWDLLPTLAELAGVSPRPGLDGRSQVALLRGGQPAPRENALYWELHDGGFRQALRWEHWKVVRGGVGAPIELYHLAEDAAETNDLAAQQPAIVERLAPLLSTLRTPSKRFPVPGLDPPLKE
jgi:arylsulfatase A-like enzyme